MFSGTSTFGSAGGGSGSLFGAGGAAFSEPTTSAAWGAKASDEAADLDTPPVAELASGDAEGEGEENEVTLFSIKGKLYKMNREENKWEALGTGIFKLKKANDTGRRRALFRQEGTQRVTLNFNLFAALKATTAAKAVVFPGLEGESLNSYRLATGSADIAAKTSEAINDAVADL